MMQFTQNHPPHQITRPNLSVAAAMNINKNNQIHRTRPWPAFPSSKALGDANCMEQLLVHCANAIESNDATLTQQILWVLNNIAPPDGDSNQRLACGFLRALMVRAARSGTCKMLAAAMASANTSLTIHTHKFSVIELASFVDLTPWHRFGFTAANAAILEASEGFSVIHIVDLSLTHCMQIPTLVDALSTRPEGPPVVKLTVAGSTDDVPPMLDLSYDDLGQKLVSFARSRGVALEFRVIPSSSSDGFAALIHQLRAHNLVGPPSSEALIINCHMMLHYIPEEVMIMDHMMSNNNNNVNEVDPYSSSSFRNMFLKAVRGLRPTLVVVVDEDADLTGSGVVGRLRAAFNYLWIPYDTVDTFMARGSEQRRWYEADVCWKIENVIAAEGAHRVERLEPKTRWVHRMRSAGFRGVPFGDDAVSEVKAMLDEHAAGWGMKKEDQDHLLLTWKGHNVVFATAWVPADRLDD